LRAAAGGVAIGGDRNADSRPANGDSAISSPIGERFGEHGSIAGIIDAFGTVGSKILDLVTLLDQPARELVLQDVSGMVSGKGNAHAGFLARKFTTRHHCGREAD
jgi:hypothetical protein